jgi:hypothetical protein
MKKLIYIDKNALLNAQSNCFDVAGRLLCAAENYQHLVKYGNKTQLQKKDYDYYNSFKFANTNDPEELYSLLIEHMNTFGLMKKRYQKQFVQQLIIPIEKNKLQIDFNNWKSGLPDKYLIRLYDAIEKLILEEDNEDYKLFFNDYKNEIEILENQKTDFDARNYMKYYPSIRYNNDEKERILMEQIKNNKDVKVEMKINKNYLDNPMNQKYENDLKNKPLDFFTANNKYASGVSVNNIRGQSAGFDAQNSGQYGNQQKGNVTQNYTTFGEKQPSSGSQNQHSNGEGQFTNFNTKSVHHQSNNNNNNNNKKKRKD